MEPWEDGDLQSRLEIREMIFHKPIVCYAGRTRDASVLMSSSSGGIFTELARVVFVKGGIVIGAKWTRDEKGFRVVHSVAENEKELAPMRGSKYVVSDMSLAWKVLKDNLTAGRMVMFTGTPCQTAAIRKKYGERDNLLLVSLICHANIAADVWQKYVQEVEQKAKSRLVAVSMRDKEGGWATPKLRLFFENSEKNRAFDFYSTSYGHSFASLGIQSCCSNCQFRCSNSRADIVIGDLWGVENVAPQYDDGKGVSAILIYSEKGKTFFDSLPLEKTSLYYEQVVQGNPNLESSPSFNPEPRSTFFRLLSSYPFSRALRIAEIGRMAELKEYYYLSHPRLVNSFPMKLMRRIKGLLR